MKYCICLLLLCCIGRFCPAQKITIQGKGMSVWDVLVQIRKQTGYDFFYQSEILSDARPINLDFRGVDLREVLDSCLRGLGLRYVCENRIIVLYPTASPAASNYSPVKGQVRSVTGEPLGGASIKIDGGGGKVADNEGFFEIPVKARLTSVTISYQGYQTQTIGLDNGGFRVVRLQPLISVLDQAIVQAYGKTTFRLLTGSVNDVSETALGTQSGGSLYEVLEGRIPGIIIRQYNGVPGSDHTALVRGRHSIAQGTDPLIVIDGVPLAANNGLLSVVGAGSAQGPMGANPLNSIPVSAISSIQLLKGAAATAIYGSGAANGVLLLTLKTGNAGQLRWQAEVNSGSDWTVKTSPLLNTSQYLRLRNEAVENDGNMVSLSTVPEAYLWDSSRYQNFQRLVMGQSRRRQGATIGLSGGDSNSVYLLSGSYNHLASVFPGISRDDRESMYGQLHQKMDHHRLLLDLSVLYSWQNNLLPVQDFTPFMYLAPNAPPFLDSAGQTESVNGLSFVNIPAQESNPYHANVSRQFNHLQLSYSVLPGLQMKTSFGYDRSQAVENSQSLASGLNSYTFNTSHNAVWEELADYKTSIGSGQFSALLGSELQEEQSNFSQTSSQDNQAPTAGARVVSSTNDRIDYRYVAFFGRINYVLHNRYILNFSGRRDGSSRFGPDNQFGNFWTLGSAWIFHEEAPFWKWPWLSFGKLRGSIGTTGNDEIGQGSLAQIYSVTTAARGYQGIQGDYPNSFANSNLQWEVNYNSEMALDLGFLQNRILLSATAYRDWTSNQLIYSSLAAQSGLPLVLSNVPATIVNTGLELSLQMVNISGRNFHWTSSVNFTLPRNRLASLPSLASSPYANSLVIGKSLSVVNGYHYEGVNANSGLFQFEAIHHTGPLNIDDILPGPNFDPRYYGGVNQQVRYKNWELDLLLEFRRENGFNPFVVLYQSNPPGYSQAGMLSNGPVEWLNRWQKPGDRALLQRVTADPASATYQAIEDYISSSAQSINASFIRVKSVSLSWRMPHRMASKLKLADLRWYIHGGNLFTFTRFPVTDPETQDPTVLPPVRTLVSGVRINW